MSQTAHLPTGGEICRSAARPGRRAAVPGCCSSCAADARTRVRIPCAHPVCVSFPAVWMHSISCATGSAMTPAAAAEFATIWDPFPIWGAAQ